jgi:hypothetical protein
LLHHPRRRRSSSNSYIVYHLHCRRISFICAAYHSSAPQSHCCTTPAAHAFHPICISCITSAAGASLHHPCRRRIVSGSFIHVVFIQSTINRLHCNNKDEVCVDIWHCDIFYIGPQYQLITIRYIFS